MGASIGNVILNGGALAFNNSFTPIERPPRGQRVAGGKGIAPRRRASGTLTRSFPATEPLTKDGAGTIVLTNNGNSWAGGTFIAAGTLQLGNGGLSGSLPGGSAVTNNGTLLLNRGSFNLGNQIPVPGVGKWPRRAHPDRRQQLRRSHDGDGRHAVCQWRANRQGRGIRRQRRHAGRQGQAGRQCHDPVRRHAGPGRAGAVAGTLTIDGDLTLQGGSLLSYALGQAGASRVAR